MRRMDKERGGRNEDGRRRGHPTDQKDDEEREKDRLSSRKGVEK